MAWKVLNEMDKFKLPLVVLLALQSIWPALIQWNMTNDRLLSVNTETNLENGKLDHHVRLYSHIRDEVYRFKGKSLPLQKYEYTLSDNNSWMRRVAGMAVAASLVMMVPSAGRAIKSAMDNLADAYEKLQRCINDHKEKFNTDYYQVKCCSKAQKNFVFCSQYTEQVSKKYGGNDWLDLYQVKVLQDMLQHKWNYLNMQLVLYLVIPTTLTIGCHVGSVFGSWQLGSVAGAFAASITLFLLFWLVWSI